MKKITKQDVIKALRSGKYHQTRGVFKRKGNDGEFYHCAVGVMLEEAEIPSEPVLERGSIYGFTSPDGDIADSIYSYVYESYPAILPYARWVWDMIDLNDEGYTFDEIADILETGEIA